MPSNTIQPANLYSQLDTLLAAVAADIRDRFARADIGSFELDIDLSGKTHGSEPAKLTYKISKYGYDEVVKGNNLNAAITEFFRRRGWNEAHQPAQITFAGQLTNDEEAA